MEITVRLEGRSPLLMHNPRLADALNPVTMELANLTSIRKKTVADHTAIGDLEWRGSLYWDDEIGAYIPSVNVVACLIEAARYWKLGDAVGKAVFALDDELPLGIKDLNAFAAKKDSHYRVTLKQGRSRIARTRPRFSQWGLTFKMELDETELSPKKLPQIIERAGRIVGLGDSRKLGFGRFMAEQVQ